MGIFSGDKRFAGERRALALMIVAVIVAGLVLAWLVLHETPVKEKPLAGLPQTTATPIPTPTPLTSEGRIQNLSTDLKAALNARLYDRQEELTRELLALDPKNLVALLASALAAERRNDTAAAIGAYDSAVAAAPTPINYYLRARLYRRTGNTAAARKDLTEASRLDANDPLVENTLMILKIEAGETEEIRSFLAGMKALGIKAGADSWVVGAAAFSLSEGRVDEAVILLKNARGVLSPKVLTELLSDPFFTPYNTDRRLEPFLMRTREARLPIESL